METTNNFSKTFASLIWDGGNSVIIPKQMGEPLNTQMTGTLGEKLAELASRVCYDSLGTGRPTPDTLQNVLSSGHLSVCEHYTRTFELEFKSEAIVTKLLPSFLNRPGVWVIPKHNILRLTMNVRSVIEFTKWTDIIAKSYSGVNEESTDMCLDLFPVIERLYYSDVPLLIQDTVSDNILNEKMTLLDIKSAKFVEPEVDNERWLSMFLDNSRGCSMELIRHGDFTAFSARSTRYCNENESSWTIHPLLEKWFSRFPEEKTKVDSFINSSKEIYGHVVKQMTDWSTGSFGGNRLAARKQARGAARGFLGNALSSETIFTVAVSQLRHIILMRASPHADAEIRELACQMLNVALQSRYRERFKDLQISPSPDGIGTVVKESD